MKSRLAHMRHASGPLRRAAQRVCTSEAWKTGDTPAAAGLLARFTHSPREGRSPIGDPGRVRGQKRASGMEAEGRNRFRVRFTTARPRKRGTPRLLPLGRVNRLLFEFNLETGIGLHV